MKKTTRWLLTISALATLTTYGAFAASTTGTTDAEVVDPFAVNQNTALSFGTFSPTGLAGTISEDHTTATNVTSVNPGVAGEFGVTGPASTAYTITVDPTATLSNGNAPDDMTATLTAPAGGTTDGAGTDTFNITGVLAVAAGQPADLYDGTYSVDVGF